MAVTTSVPRQRHTPVGVLYTANYDIDYAVHHHAWWSNAKELKYMVILGLLPRRYCCYCKIKQFSFS